MRKRKGAGRLLPVLLLAALLLPAGAAAASAPESAGTAVSASAESAAPSASLTAEEADDGTASAWEVLTAAVAVGVVLVVAHRRQSGGHGGPDAPEEKD